MWSTIYNTCCQCPITNASQRAHSAQPHTDVEIMKFLVLPFLDEILSNLFVCVNILAIIIQQVCSNKTILVWSIWPNLSQTLHKTPCYGPGSQLWRANGRGLYLALTTKFPTWCVEGVSVGTALLKDVCGLRQGWFTTWGKSVKYREYHLNYGFDVQQNQFSQNFSNSGCMGCVNVLKAMWQQVHQPLDFFQSDMEEVGKR